MAPRLWKVGTANIDDSAVTEGKIGALAVTAGKLGALAVTEAKLAANAVTVTKLDATVRNVLPYPILSPTDNANGTGDVLISVRDAAGNPLAGRFAVIVWAASTDMGPPTAQEEFAYTKGEAVSLGLEESLILFVVTAADGEGGVRVTLTGGGTRYVMASLAGRIVSATLTITDPE